MSSNCLSCLCLCQVHMLSPCVLRLSLFVSTCIQYCTCVVRLPALFLLVSSDCLSFCLYSSYPPSACLVSTVLVYSDSLHCLFVFSNYTCLVSSDCLYVSTCILRLPVLSLLVSSVCLSVSTCTCILRLSVLSLLVSSYYLSYLYFCSPPAYLYPPSACLVSTQYTGIVYSDCLPCLHLCLVSPTFSICTLYLYTQSSPSLSTYFLHSFFTCPLRVCFLSSWLSFLSTNSVI